MDAAARAINQLLREKASEVDRRRANKAHGDAARVRLGEDEVMLLHRLTALKETRRERLAKVRKPRDPYPSNRARIRAHLTTTSASAAEAPSGAEREESDPAAISLDLMDSFINAASPVRKRYPAAARSIAPRPQAEALPVSVGTQAGDGLDSASSSEDNECDSEVEDTPSGQVVVPASSLLESSKARGAKSSWQVAVQQVGRLLTYSRKRPSITSVGTPLHPPSLPGSPCRGAGTQNLVPWVHDGEFWPKHREILTSKLARLRDTIRHFDALQQSERLLDARLLKAENVFFRRERVGLYKKLYGRFNKRMLPIAPVWDDAAGDEVEAMLAAMREAMEKEREDSKQAVGELHTQNLYLVGEAAVRKAKGEENVWRLRSLVETLEQTTMELHEAAQAGAARVPQTVVAEKDRQIEELGSSLRDATAKADDLGAALAACRQENAVARVSLAGHGRKRAQALMAHAHELCTAEAKCIRLAEGAARHAILADCARRAAQLGPKDAEDRLTARVATLEDRLAARVSIESFERRLGPSLTAIDDSAGRFEAAGDPVQNLLGGLTRGIAQCAREMAEFARSVAQHACLGETQHAWDAAVASFWGGGFVAVVQRAEQAWAAHAKAAEADALRRERAISPKSEKNPGKSDTVLVERSETTFFGLEKIQGGPESQFCPASPTIVQATSLLCFDHPASPDWAPEAPPDLALHFTIGEPAFPPGPAPAEDPAAATDKNSSFSSKAGLPPPSSPKKFLPRVRADSGGRAAGKGLPSGQHARRTSVKGQGGGLARQSSQKKGGEHVCSRCKGGCGEAARTVGVQVDDLALHRLMMFDESDNWPDFPTDGDDASQSPWLPVFADTAHDLAPTPAGRSQAQAHKKFEPKKFDPASQQLAALPRGSSGRNAADPPRQQQQPPVASRESSRGGVPAEKSHAPRARRGGDGDGGAVDDDAAAAAAAGNGGEDAKEWQAGVSVDATGQVGSGQLPGLGEREASGAGHARLPPAAKKAAEAGEKAGAGDPVANRNPPLEPVPATHGSGTPTRGAGGETPPSDATQPAPAPGDGTSQPGVSFESGASSNPKPRPDVDNDVPEQGFRPQAQGSAYADASSPPLVGCPAEHDELDGSADRSEHDGRPTPDQALNTPLVPVPGDSPLDSPSGRTSSEADPDARAADLGRADAPTAVRLQSALGHSRDAGGNGVPLDSARSPPADSRNADATAASSLHANAALGNGGGGSLAAAPGATTPSTQPDSAPRRPADSGSANAAPASALQSDYAPSGGAPKAQPDSASARVEPPAGDQHPPLARGTSGPTAQAASPGGGARSSRGAFGKGPDPRIGASAGVGRLLKFPEPGINRSRVGTALQRQRMRKIETIVKGDAAWLAVRKTVCETLAEAVSALCERKVRQIKSPGRPPALRQPARDESPLMSLEKKGGVDSWDRVLACLTPLKGRLPEKKKGFKGGADAATRAMLYFRQQLECLRMKEEDDRCHMLHACSSYMEETEALAFSLGTTGRDGGQWEAPPPETNPKGGADRTTENAPPPPQQRSIDDGNQRAAGQPAERAGPRPVDGAPGCPTTVEHPKPPLATLGEPEHTAGTTTTTTTSARTESPLLLNASGSFRSKAAGLVQGCVAAMNPSAAGVYQERIQSLVGELNAAVQTLGELRGQAATRDALLLKLEGELTDKSALVQKTRAECRELDHAASQARAKAAALQVDLEKTISGKSQMIRVLESRVAEGDRALKRACDVWEGKYAALQKTLKQLVEAEELKTSKQAELVCRLKQTRGHLAKRKDVEVQEQVEAAKRKCDGETRRAIADLNSAFADKREALLKELADLQKLKHAAQGKVRELEDAVGESRKETERARALHAEEKERHAATHAATSALAAAHLAEKADLLQAQAAADERAKAAARAHERALKLKDKAAADMQHRVDAAARERDRLAVKVEQLQAAVADAESDRADLVDNLRQREREGHVSQRKAASAGTKEQRELLCRLQDTSKQLERRNLALQQQLKEEASRRDRREAEDNHWSSHGEAAAAGLFKLHALLLAVLKEVKAAFSLGFVVGEPMDAGWAVRRFTTKGERLSSGELGRLEGAIACILSSDRTCVEGCLQAIALQEAHKQRSKRNFQATSAVKDKAVDPSDTAANPQNDAEEQSEREHPGASANLSSPGLRATPGMRQYSIDIPAPNPYGSPSPRLGTQAPPPRAVGSAKRRPHSAAGAPQWPFKATLAPSDAVSMVPTAGSNSPAAAAAAARAFGSEAADTIFQTLTCSRVPLCSPQTGGALASGQAPVPAARPASSRVSRSHPVCPALPLRLPGMAGAPKDRYAVVEQRELALVPFSEVTPRMKLPVTLPPQHSTPSIPVRAHGLSA
ncbi:hypothetical protein DIPPA_11201 [Diplonema papillatum]|nr:hypothetical protein DIPPA_11201 [Diplonema papillatum]